MVEIEATLFIIGPIGYFCAGEGLCEHAPYRISNGEYFEAFFFAQRANAQALDSQDGVLRRRRKRLENKRESFVLRANRAYFAEDELIVNRIDFPDQDVGDTLEICHIDDEEK